jgi:enamine deaminase RidA (YjgF/YER057c/UK114 family)
MDDAAVLAKLAELGLELPEPQAPLAAYVPLVVSGSLAFVSGQVPFVDGIVVNPGRVGTEVSIDDAQIAARRAGLQALAVLRSGLGGSLERVERIAQVTVYVASPPEFMEHPKVANGASELFAAVMGEAGTHTRAAIGVSSLPLGACVELALTAALT